MSHKLDEEVCGDCDKTKKVIRISADTDNHKDIYSTLLHEIIHATLHEVSADQCLSGEMDEIVADNIANVLYKEFFSPKGVKRWSE